MKKRPRPISSGGDHDHQASKELTSRLESGWRPSPPGAQTEVITDGGIRSGADGESRKANLERDHERELET
ncbi:hypothetical protein [Hyphomonas sp.]|uniref:hypothetical protein n=1 Tax=Hyphomonas sp. TaxID=87 RepID=UPI0025BF4434|nr:hypothetical protein [Hyphomonas sp.]